MITYQTLGVYGLWDKTESRPFDAGEMVARSSLDPIHRRLDRDPIEIIVGPRQSGKTTLMFLLIDRLLAAGIPAGRIFYLNLDTTVVVSQFDHPSLFVAQLTAGRTAREDRIYLFVDEIQRLKSPGRFLKGVYDLGKNIKIVVSGSSSLEIRSKVKEFLTGRKRETRLLPLSFAEMVAHEQILPGSLEPEAFDGKTVDAWRRREMAFGAYLSEKMMQTAVFGGYPAVYLAGTDEERVETLSEIYHSYVRKDVVDLMNIAKIDVFMNLVQALSAQVGNLINKSEICSLIGSNAVTVTKFINILSETWVVARLPPYVSTKRNEIKRAHKCFFMDCGLRNFAIKQFGHMTLRPDRGALLENLAFTELAKTLSGLEGLYFWRTKAGAEMDFVLEKGGLAVPVEVKSGPAVPGRHPKSFHAFVNHFSPKSAVYLNRDRFHLDRIGRTNVYCIPAHWFLLYGRKMLPRI